MLTVESGKGSDGGAVNLGALSTSGSFSAMNTYNVFIEVQVEVNSNRLTTGCGRLWPRADSVRLPGVLLAGLRIADIYAGIWSLRCNRPAQARSAICRKWVCGCALSSGCGGPMRFFGKKKAPKAKAFGALVGEDGFEPSKPKQQIYSLSPLTTRELSQIRRWLLYHRTNRMSRDISNFLRDFCGRVHPISRRGKLPPDSRRI